MRLALPWLAPLLLAALPAPAFAAGGEVYALRPEVDVPVAAVSALAIVIPTAFARDLIRERCPCDPSEVNAFDRGAIGNHSGLADVASDVTAVAAILVPPLADLVDLGPVRPFWQDAAVFAETLLVNGALTELAKVTVQRPLPRTYAGDPGLLRDPGGYRSFYSGHTSTTFAALGAAAFTIRERYGERVWPWIGVGIVGASVGVERVAAGRHFPSDVLVGAAAGLAVGVAVPWLHARLAPHRLALVPGPANGVALAGVF